MRRTSPERLSPALSTFLDAVRLVAALLVFLGHAVGFLGGLFWQIEPYQHEAVVVFFVLSGFLISYAVDRGDRSATQYVIARAARIYSVVLLALLVTVLSDTLGRAATPSLYQDFGPWWTVVAQPFFVNTLWGRLWQPGSNGPFWTLNYEVWFYIVFGLVLFMPGRWRWVSAALAIAFMGPWFVLLFPLWLAGVASYRFSQTDLSSTLQWALALAPLLAWGAYEVHALAGHRWLDAPSIFGRKMYWQDVLVATCFGLSLAGLSMLTRGPRQIVPRGIASAIGWLAGASFTLYLVHLPVMISIVAWMPWPRSALASRLAILLGVPAITLVLAELGERRKASWRRMLARIAERCRAVASPATSG